MVTIFFEYVTLLIVLYSIKILDKKDINIFSISGDDTEITSLRLCEVKTG
jgi:hypothetical protein